jgi:HK97 family phage major capsid protein
MTIGVGTGGQVVYMPPGGLSGAPYATLMGRPVVPVEYAASLGTPGDISLVDPSHYVTISKGGIVQAQSIHVEFLTDQVALRFTMRVDGETWENAPVVPYKGDATKDVQSSFITLAAR